MVISTRTLARVAALLGNVEDAALYNERRARIEAQLHSEFWDEARQLFDDFYLDEAG